MSQCYFLLTCNASSRQARVVYLGKDLSAESIRLIKLQLWKDADYGTDPQPKIEPHLGLPSVSVTFVMIENSSSSLFFHTDNKFVRQLVSSESGIFSLPKLFDAIGESLIIEYLGCDFLKLSLAVAPPSVESLSRTDEQELMNIVCFPTTSMEKRPQQIDDENIIYVPLNRPSSASNPQEIPSYLLSSFDDDSVDEHPSKVFMADWNESNQPPDKSFPVFPQEHPVHASQEE